MSLNQMLSGHQVKPTKRSKLKECKFLASKVCDAIGSKLPAKDKTQVEEYIHQYAEWEIGIEHLVYTLIEEKIGISQLEYDQVVEACQVMKVKVSIGIIIEK